MIDRKLEPLVKREMIKYLGELEDDDLVMFVLEHLKDHKNPQKLVEGLEPVRVTLTLSQFGSSTDGMTGSRRRSRRVDDQCLATSHFREYGLWRGTAHRTPDGGLMIAISLSDSSHVVCDRWCVCVESSNFAAKLYKSLCSSRLSIALEEEGGVG